MSPRLKRVLLLLAVALGTLALRVPFFVEPPGRDQSLHRAEAQSLLAGGELYVDVWDHRAPGMALAYTLAQGSVGPGYLSMHLLDALALAATAALLFALLERRLGAVGPAFAGAGLYALCAGSVAFGAFWGRAQAEVLMDPLVALTLLLLYGSRTQDGPTSRQMLGAGLALAGAIGLKYSALPLVLLSLPVLLRPGTGWYWRTQRSSAFALGVVLPVAGALGWFAGTGRLALFWQATVEFNLAHGAVAALPRDEDLLARILYQPGLLLPLYLLAGLSLAGLASELSSTRRITSAVSRTTLLGLCLWCLRLGEIFWQAKFWIYHYQVVLLPLCVLAAAGAVRLTGWLARITPAIGWARAAALAVGAWMLLPLARESTVYAAERDLAAGWQGRAGREAMLARYRWGDSDFDALETLQVAERLRAEMEPDERLFVWGFEAGLYADSGRLPAARFLFDYPLMPRFTPFHERFVELLMGDLRLHPPARVVVVGGDPNAIEPAESTQQLLDIPALRDWVGANYEPDWQLGDFWVLRPVAQGD